MAKPKNISHAVFNNNPGNIKHSVNGKKLDYLKVLDKLGIKYSKGSEAEDGGYFIKFESHSDGYTAAKEWWPTVKSWVAYKGLTLDQALQKYSGEGYSSEKLGLDLDGDKLLSEYSDEQLSGVMTSQIKMEDPKEYKILQDEGLLSKEEVVVTPQNQTVLDADGNPVVIPTGEDVTEADLRQSQTGEQTYTSWDELEQNMNNFDKNQPFYVGEGEFKKRYKWNAEKEQVQLVDQDGEYLADEVQVNNRDLNDIFRENPIDNSPTAEEVQAAREDRIVEYQNSAQYQLDTEEERQVKIAEINALEGNVIIDPGSSNQEIIEEIIEPAVPTVVDPVSEEVVNNEVVTEAPIIPEVINEDVVTEDGVTTPNTLNKLGQAGSSLLKGGAALLDSIGGPGAIISYVMGKKGLKEAMKEVKPQASAELSPMFMQHLRQSRELAKKGFHPDEARLIQKEMDGAFQKGLENAVRGSGGQRATFLAQSGILDSQRSSALLEYAAKDAELQRTNADKYEKLIMFKENFDIQQTEKERAEDMAKQVANKDAAAQFTSAAFTNVMSGIGGGMSSLLNKQMGTPSQFISRIQGLMNNTGNTGTNE